MDVAESMLEPFPVNSYRNLVEFITEHAMKPGYQYSKEFEYGLDLILDGLERSQASQLISLGMPDARARSRARLRSALREGTSPQIGDWALRWKPSCS